MNSVIIEHYFPNLDPYQKECFRALGDLYPEWNSKINVISRKDIDNLYIHHILHSLAIAAFLGDVSEGSTFVDVGTGGGFPAIPLAIIYPNSHFHLVDRIGKKLKVAQEISSAIGLKNVSFMHGDMGECHEKFDFALSRAVMPLDSLVRVVRKNISPVCRNSHPNGLVCLKGGDLADESRAINYPVIEIPITDFFNDPFFNSKAVVFVPMIKKQNKR